MRSGDFAVFAHPQTPVGHKKDSLFSNKNQERDSCSDLQEQSSIHPIRLLLEHRAEDDGHPIMARLDIYRLLFAVFDDLELASLFCGFHIHLLSTSCVLEIGLERRLLGKSPEERGGHCSSFK